MIYDKVADLKGLQVVFFSPIRRWWWKAVWNRSIPGHQPKPLFNQFWPSLVSPCVWWVWWAMMGGDVWEVGKIKIQNSGKKISKVVKSLSFVSSSCLQKLSCLFSPVAFSWFFIGCLPLTKSKMTIEHPRFEDVFPIKHGDFPASHFSFRGVTTQPKQAKHGSLDYGVQSESTTIHPLREAKLFLSTIEFLPFPIEIYIIYIL